MIAIRRITLSLTAQYDIPIITDLTFPYVLIMLRRTIITASPKLPRESDRQLQESEPVGDL